MRSGSRAAGATSGRLGAEGRQAHALAVAGHPAHTHTLETREQECIRAAEPLPLSVESRVYRVSQIRNVSTIGKPDNTRDTKQLNERPSIIFVFEEKNLTVIEKHLYFRIVTFTNCLTLELTAQSTFPLSLQPLCTLSISVADLGIVTCRCLVIL